MTELLMGLSLGLGAGVTPGALLTLVITASLRGGFRSGVRLACVPLLSDLPVVLLAVTAVGALPQVLLRVLAVGGGLYVVHLGVETLREARTALPPRPGEDAPSSAREILRGVVVNMLNPTRGCSGSRWAHRSSSRRGTTPRRTRWSSWAGSIWSWWVPRWRWRGPWGPGGTG